ncbi:glycosyltransferase [Clostridium bowmanii]|uniref:glycosyltransferase family 2 protein n=1 Tax=Clostridium bowmanii TaxID=132925 RepID=UPI001C0B9E10|nr:glycosyltransferase [Clostridium bowmanii]MBU3188427.1 glycosyltransferase [Clostridium bowmanii]MCA1072816.1 glycosyltransferase [Clostridium bowmanii]
MKLSIIIPTYNVEKHIRTTINSLIVQSEKKFEIIIVDDGSTDNTIEIVSSIIRESKLSNCELITKVNGGVSSARNVGIRKASGKYIMFLDGDDYVAKNLVQCIYEKIAYSDRDIICFGCDIVDENKAIIKNYFDIFEKGQGEMTGIDALNNIINHKNMWIYTGSAVYRNEFLTQRGINYTQGCVNGEDQEFTIKALAWAKDIIFIDSVLCYYVQRETSISNSYNIKRFDTIAALTRTYKYLENIGSAELTTIAKKIKNQHIVDNYIYNFDCCLDYIYKTCELSKESFKNLYAEIEGAYPLSSKEVISSMRNYKGKNIKILFKVKMFLNSPALYIWIFSLKNKIKVMRRGNI